MFRGKYVWKMHGEGDVKFSMNNSHVLELVLLGFHGLVVDEIKVVQNCMKEEFNFKMAFS